MLLNVTNHPFDLWSDKQKVKAVEQWGCIQDLPFPSIDPCAEDQHVKMDALQFAQIILSMQPTAVHIMGEQTFCFAVITQLQLKGITCYASTTQRQVKTLSGHKISKFEFVRFRAYPQITH